MKQQRAFNINYYVYFKLTNYGKRLIDDREYGPPFEDIGEGWYRAQMHVLMRELGGELPVAFNQVSPIEAEIRFDACDLEDMG